MKKTRIRSFFAGLTVLTVLFFAGNIPFSMADDSAADKASKELIKQFTTLVGDVTAMRNMSDQEKVEYILKNGADRIKKQTADSIKDAAKDKLIQYAASRMRADLFKAEIPDMMHKAIIEGKNVGSLWSAADVKIKSKLDTQLNAVKAGIETVEIAWDVYSSWSTKGAEEGLRKLGEKVGDKIMEYFIPGWGYYRLAQELVKALGEYVLGYAFQSGLEGNIKDILGSNHPKSNPAGFAQWIMTVDVESYVQREWDEELAYNRRLYLRGKKGEGEEMKRAIIAELNKMKQEVLKRKQTEKEIQAKLEQLDNETRMRSDEIKALADRAMQTAAPALSLIEDFKVNIYGYKRIDADKEASEQAQKFRENTSQIKGSGSAYEYTSFGREKILSELEAALFEIHETGISGYDKESFQRIDDNYSKIRKEAIDASLKRIAEIKEKCQKKLADLRAQYAPQLSSLSSAMSKASGEERERLRQRHNSVSGQYQAAAKPYNTVFWSRPLEKGHDAELALLAAEEKALYAAALERGAKKRAEMKNWFEDAREKLDKALNEFGALWTETNDQKNLLHNARGWRSSEYFESRARELEARSKGLEFSIPGDVSGEYMRLQNVKQDLTSDKRKVGTIDSNEKAMFRGYVAATDALVSSYEGVVPTAVRRIEESPTVSANEKMLISDYFGIPKVAGVLNHMSISIPRPWGYRSFREESERLGKTPFPSDIFERVLDRRIQELAPMAYADETAVLYGAIAGRVGSKPIMMDLVKRTVEQEKKRAEDMLPSAFNNAAHMFIEPENSKLADYIAQLEEAWEANADAIKQLNVLKKSIGNLVKYKSGFQERSYPVLEAWNTIPERIKILREIYEKGEKSYEERTALIERYLAEAKEKLEDVMDGKIPPRRIEDLEKILKSANNRVSHTNAWLTHGGTDRLKQANQEWKDFRDQVEKALKESEEAAFQEAEQDREKWKRAKEERKAREEEERKRGQEEEDKKFYSNITLNDVRINGFSLEGRMGEEVVLTNDEIKNGSIELSGELSTVDRVKKISLSLDGGETWNGLKKNKKISYTFKPFPKRAYRLMLKIDTEVGDVLIDVFPGVNTISYDNTDYVQIVVEAVKTLSSAYEAKNISGFADLISKDFLGNRVFLEEGVRFDFDMFSDIRLQIFINRIQKRGKTFAVETKWNKTQVPRKTGMEQRTTGETTMLFVTEDGRMKIQNLRGNLIYATLSPEIAESSGLRQDIVEEIRLAQLERNPVQPGASTEEGGGISTLSSNIETGTFTLTQTALHPAPAWIQEFSFRTRQVYTMDLFDLRHDFTRQEGWLHVGSGSGIRDMGGTNLNSITEAPSSGYARSVGAVSGNTYAIQLADGTYALVMATAWGEFPTPFTTTFRYKHQKNGTRAF